MTTISKQVNQGDSVSIQATPKTGYTFSGWTSGVGDSRISTDNPYTFTPNADTSINAVFSEVQPIISWVGNPGNLVIKNSNGQTYNLWSGAGTNKYYGDVEGFGANDIVSVWISGNDPESTSSLIEHTWLTEINLSGLTNLTLGRRSFAYCTTLTTVVLPTASYSIADGAYNISGAFQGCTALNNLTLGGCTSIGAYAFYGCSALRTVNIPGSCTSIGTDAFYNAGISTLTLAEGIQTIRQYAFANNYRMTSVSFPSTLSSYGTGAFLGCYGLATITMNSSGTYFQAISNCLYRKNDRSLRLGCKTSTIHTSGSVVNKIYASAFNEMIKSGANVNISIPSNITTIGDSAFYGCDGLTGVIFRGSSINYIEGYAFRSCTALTSITIPSITSFGSSQADGNYVFGDCTNLATINLVANSTPPTLYGNEISMFPDTIKIYVKPGTMSAYQNDSKWAYWYNQKRLYIGVGISSDVDPAGSSTVSTSSNNVEIRSDSAAPTVVLTATPNTGYTFSSWKRGNTVLSTSNPYTATVVDDGTGTDEFTAYSTVASYSISASVNPNGGGTVSGTGSYNYGASCTVSATASTGYDFVNWTESGSTVSSSSSYTFTVSQARTLVANFELETFTISASPNTSGYGTISGNSGTYSYGDTVSLTATAASGYEFSEWTENGTTVSSNATYTFTATQDRTLVAVFVAGNAIEINTTGSDTVYLKNNSNQTYTWNLTSGNNRYTGSVSGFELNNLKSIYRFSTSSSSTDSVITSVNISESSISVIPSYAFYNCTALATLVLSDTLETINDDAFYNCTALTSFTIPSSVKYIDRTSFDQSGWWSNQTDAIMYKDNICFGYKSTEPTGSVSITSGTRVIAGGALDLCTGITSISLPNSLKIINSLAFNYCSGLHSLTIPSSVEYIGLDTVGNSGIYSDAAEHTFLVLSDCVVGYKGSQTGRITLPSTTRLISSQAFAFQTGITEFVINRATPPIYCPYALDTANNPGDGSCTSPIYVPSANVNTYKAADGWTAVASRIQGFTNNTISASVSPSGSGTISGTGDYMAGDSCTLVCTPATGYTFVNWTEGGTEVSTSASYSFTVNSARTLVANFSAPPAAKITATANASDVLYIMDSDNIVYTWNLTSGTNILNDGDISGLDFSKIIKVYKNTSDTTAKYQSTGLTSLDLSEITSITGGLGRAAFYRVGSLTSIILPPNLTGSLSYYALGATSITSIDLPEGITGLGEYALFSTKLTEIKSKSITTLQSYSLGSCPNLEKIILPMCKTISQNALNNIGSQSQTNGVVIKIGNYFSYSNTGTTRYTGRLQIHNSAFGSNGNSKITDIYLDFCDGPTQISSTSLSTAISTSSPNSTYIVHVDEDYTDESYWDNVKNMPSARVDDACNMSTIYNGEF